MESSEVTITYLNTGNALEMFQILIQWIRIQHFKDIRIRIQRSDDQKLKSFLEKKLQFTYPSASLKDVQATGEASSLKVGTLKYEIF